MRIHAACAVTGGLLLAAPLTAQSAGQAAGGQSSDRSQDTAAAEKAFTFEGEAALWTVAIRPDKTDDFERVLARLREALAKSEKPERRRQAEGWKVLRLSMPLPDGNIAYVHVVDPVVAGADYSIMQVLYDEFPDERQMLYELYRGALARNLSLATGVTAIDLDPAAPAPAPGIRPPSPPPAPAPSAPPAPPTPSSPPPSPGGAAGSPR